MNHAMVRTRPRAEAAMSGYDGVPWPKFLRSQAALVVPQVPGLLRPLDEAAGWSGSPE